MELEEPYEEWNTTSQNSSELNGGKVSWVFNRGLRLGKQILVAGLVASSAPVVLPPLVVVSAIGLAVSMPYAFFLASHACTQNLMSKLLPSPTPPRILFHSTSEEEKQERLDREEESFHGDTDIDIDKEEQDLADETKRGVETRIEMVDVENMNNEKDLTLGNDYGQGVVNKDKPELSHSQDAVDVIEDNGSKKDNSDYFYEEEKASSEKQNNVKLGAKIDGGMEGHLRGESKGEQPMIGCHGVVTTIEGLDKIGNDIEEFKTPFEVTNVDLEEFGDQAIEGDIEEAELERETKGLSEKIRDEGRTDSGGEYVKGIHGGTNKSDKKLGPAVENMEIAWEDENSCTIGGTEGDVRKEEEPKVCEEMLQSRNAENMDTIYNEVESAESARGMLEGKRVENTNDSQKPMAESSQLLDGRSVLYETIPVEPVGDLLIETQEYNISVAEDSSEVTSENTNIHIIVKEESKPLQDGPPILQEGKLDNNISDYVNQESQLHEYNEIVDSSNADAREIADESGLDLLDKKRVDPEEYTYTIDMYEESSNVMVDGHTDPMEVLVSSVEHKFRTSECSSGKDIMCPSHEVVFNEENIWKQIHVIRKIVGYEGTPQASCADELKALYIFTGVEAPTFLKENSCDPAEINEKLHFLMSIVGIKSNVA